MKKIEWGGKEYGDDTQMMLFQIVFLQWLTLPQSGSGSANDGDHEYHSNHLNENDQCGHESIR
jgi:hypothetical protein